MSLIGWRYKKEIVIDNTGNDNNYENTLVHINLSPDNFDFSKARFDGSDIRFVDSDGVTSLDYYIEDYDYDSQEATIYVKIPLLPANQTKSIYIYYGNMNAVNQSDKSIMMSGFQYNPDPFNDGSCIVYYPFDGDTNDHSGNGYLGTWHGNEQYDNGVFGIGQCAKFDGKSYIETNINRFPSIITLSFWFKQGVLDTSHGHAYFHFSKNNENTLMLWQHEMFFRIHNSTDIALPKKYDDNCWHHLAVTSTGKVFVDGIQVLTIGSVNMTQINKNFIIGADRDSGGMNEYLQNGTCVDQLYIFNRELTNDEIQTLYITSHPTTVTPNETRFSSRLAGTIVDSNGNPITGKNINVYTFTDFNQPMIMKTTTTTGNWELNDFPADPGAEVLVTFESKENNIKLAGASYTTTQES